MRRSAYAGAWALHHSANSRSNAESAFPLKTAADQPPNDKKNKDAKAAKNRNGRWKRVSNMVIAGIPGRIVTVDKVDGESGSGAALSAGRDILYYRRRPM